LSSFAIEVCNLRKEFIVKKKKGVFNRKKEREVFVAVDGISFHVSWKYRFPLIDYPNK